jgi:hypothetical protein
LRNPVANGQAAAVGLAFARKFLAQNVLDRAVFCTHVRGQQVTRALLKSVLRFCAPERIDTLKFFPLTITLPSANATAQGEFKFKADKSSAVIPMQLEICIRRRQSARYSFYF